MSMVNDQICCMIHTLKDIQNWKAGWLKVCRSKVTGLKLWFKINRERFLRLANNIHILKVLKIQLIKSLRINLASN